MYEAYTCTEVATKLPIEISSLASQNSSGKVLAGCKTGNLLVYSPCVGKLGYELHNLGKNFERKAVAEMQVIDEERCALWLAVSGRKQLHIYEWLNENFIDWELDFGDSKHLASFADNPQALLWPTADSLVFAVRDEYFFMRISRNETMNCRLNKVCRCSETPLVVAIPDRRLIGLAVGETVTFADLWGQKSPELPDVRFSDLPLQIVYDRPYLVALTRSRVEVRSLHPPNLIQPLAIKANFMTRGLPGQIIVGTGMDISLLDANAQVRKNVAFLAKENQFELAIQLAEASNLLSDSDCIDLKRQAAMNLFRQRKFEEAFNLFTEIRIEVIEVLQLFPELVRDNPEADKATSILTENEKKKAYEPLSRYLSTVRADLSKELKRNLDAAEAKAKRNLILIVDTTLLKCYLKTSAMMVESLLRMPDSAVSFNDAEKILKAENRLKELYVLYSTRRQHELALSLLQEQATQPNPLDYFRGVVKVVQYLQSLGNQHLDMIFRFAKWVVRESPEQGLAIFISDDSEFSPILDRERVVQFFKREYIPGEHAIYKWGEKRTKFHEQLVEFYVAKVRELMKDYMHVFKDGELEVVEHYDECLVRAGQEEGELGVVRKKLLRFLEFSSFYNPSTILVQLSGYAFYEERALILGRLKKHEQALTIYTSILHDFPAAERYCQIYYNPEDPVNSKVYLQLFRAYVSPSDPQVAGLSEVAFTAPEPNMPQAIHLLKAHANCIDTVEALSLIPPETPLKVLAETLNAVLQTTHDKATATNLRRCICECALRKSEEKRRKAEGHSVLVLDSSICSHCKKKIGNSAFVMVPTSGELSHHYCYQESTNLSPTSKAG